MHVTTNPLRAGVLALAGLIFAAGCAGSGGAGWTYAPLGPTPEPDASGSPAATPGSSPAATPGGSPAATPDGSPGLPVDVATTQDNPLAFEPDVLEAPADSVVTVSYLNDSNLPHNINFFDGPDENSDSLGATEVVTGPGESRSVTFTTPAQPGDYYFWCDVHLAAMAGTLRVTQ